MQMPPLLVADENQFSCKYPCVRGARGGTGLTEQDAGVVVVPEIQKLRNVLTAVAALPGTRLAVTLATLGPWTPGSRFNETVHAVFYGRKKNLKSHDLQV
jgi:hypothetical protein